MKTTILGILLLLCTGLAAPVAAQTFPVDTLVKTGPLDQRINLVFIPDGYEAAEMPLFLTRVNETLMSLFAESPFREYRPYFNAFAIKVPSVQSGSTHPRTAPDCGAVAAFTADTYFGNTFDFANIHRLLATRQTSTIGSVLVRNFPSYDQVFVLVNSTVFGGSGGQFATFSADRNATEIALHEVGHSLALLADEYWAGQPRETANMTQTTNPATVRWAPWVGANGVGIYPHTSNPTWQKPHFNCNMQFLGSPFCSVCKEALIERFHDLASPLQAYSPTSLAIANPSQNLQFALNLLVPTPNTLKVTWTRDGTVFARNTSAVTVPLAQVSSGRHQIRAVVVDTTALTRRATHFTQHSYTVDWTISNTVTGMKLA
ncbi:MAG TPA: M64 family metallopeptidase, partial [Hymenobacter sp.]|nr:M64 family metallopeptidase [Hymenobacter sp.]